MTTLRLRLPRLAALVLLVWLFATGVAFAQTCASTIDLECIECCEEMKPSPASSEAQPNSVLPAQVEFALPSPAVAPTLLWPDAGQPGASRPEPPALPADNITIRFLRLAL